MLDSMLSDILEGKTKSTTRNSFYDKKYVDVTNKYPDLKSRGIHLTILKKITSSVKLNKLERKIVNSLVDQVSDDDFALFLKICGKYNFIVNSLYIEFIEKGSILNENSERVLKASLGSFEDRKKVIKQIYRLEASHTVKSILYKSLVGYALLSDKEVSICKSIDFMIDEVRLIQATLKKYQKLEIPSGEHLLNNLKRKIYAKSMLTKRQYTLIKKEVGIVKPTRRIRSF